MTSFSTVVTPSASRARARSGPALTTVAALLTAASSGAFLVYSSFTGTALADLPGATAIAAMQELNEAAVASPTFMALIFVPALLGPALAVRGLVQRAPGTAWLVAGAAVYGVGVVGVTMGFHVPRNEALAGWDPAARAADWPGWIASWIAVNHVRSVSALVAAGLMAMSLRVPARRAVTGS